MTCGFQACTCRALGPKPRPTHGLRAPSGGRAFGWSWRGLLVRLASGSLGGACEGGGGVRASGGSGGGGGEGGFGGGQGGGGNGGEAVMANGTEEGPRLAGRGSGPRERAGLLGAEGCEGDAVGVPCEVSGGGEGVGGMGGGGSGGGAVAAAVAVLARAVSGGGEGGACAVQAAGEEDVRAPLLSVAEGEEEGQG